MSDIKGLQMEQDREGKIRNEDIDSKRTNRNFDFIESEDNLYHRVKKRVALLKATGSRVQTNSVVTYSNILTVPAETAAEWGEEKTDKYFEACKDYFVERWGIENVVSAKVHKDETTPHMHLHFLPVNKENGKLQARVIMKRATICEIHEQLPIYLQHHGFDVTRAEGKTAKRGNIDNVHVYKKFMDEVEQQNAALDKKVALVDGKNKILIERENILNSKVTSWKTNQAARDKKLEEDSAKMNVLAKKLTDQQKIFEQQQLNIQTLMKQKKELEEKQQQLDAAIQTKTLDYNVHHTDFVKLTQNYNAKYSEYTKLTQVYDTQKQNFSKLKEIYAEWSKALGTIKNSYQVYSNKYTTVKSDCEKKEQELVDLTSKTNEKASELDEMQKQYSTKKSDLESITGKYNILKANYNDLSIQIRKAVLLNVLNTVQEITYSKEHGIEIFRKSVSESDFELSKHAMIKNQNGRLVADTTPVFQHIGNEIKKEIDKVQPIQDDGPSF